MTVLLGVDFGTSNTVAVLRFPDGRSRPLLFDGSPIMPSAVFADEQALLIGRDAEHSARIHPERFEPNPKRRIDDGTVLLGGRQVEVVDLFAAVLRRVLTEANRITGGTDIQVTLTHPAGWGTPRTGVLLAAAARAGMRNPRLVPEPVAAAAYFLHALKITVPVGGSIVVYDFGAGTFDASVVRREPNGFSVLASEGLNDAGGLDIDAAVAGHLGATIVARDAAAWRRLDQPETDADRRALRLFREDVRAAKEILSRTASTYVHVPLIDDSLPIGREQLETLARPVLDRTVAATGLVIRRAALPAAPAAIFLVGGSSRIPLAATLLHQQLGILPSAVEQPELVVADGSVHAAAVVAPPAPVAPVSAVPASAPPRPTYPPQAAPATPASPYAQPRPVIPTQPTAPPVAPNPATLTPAMASPAVPAPATPTPAPAPAGYP
ncbi:MAG TPA: Hsp70 family protein, partial [Rugosimonospora sp.]|nr:Hsp70 family protein [Rugosimonospora sp.]